MSGAIGIILGHNIREDRVRTLMLLSLIGDTGKEVLKEVGIKFGQKVAGSLLKKIPGKLLIEINKKIGFRLLTKAGEKGLINLTIAIPIVGGFVGGTFDATSCRAVGFFAQNLFQTMAIEGKV